MPLIQVQVTAPLTPQQDTMLHTELTNAVVEVFHKPVEYVMVHVESQADLWMAGEKLTHGALVSVCLMGDMQNADCDAFTARVCGWFKQEMGIPGEKVYTLFQTINQWGWNGKIL